MPSKIDGGHVTALYLKAPDAQSPNEPVFWNTTPAIIMPSTTTLYDFGQGTLFNASLDLWYDLYFKAYIHIGNYYYNGTSWAYVAPGETPPKCDVTLWSDTNEIKWVTGIGQRVIGTKNYYYTISNPYRGSNLVDRYTNQTSLITNIGGISIHNQPLQGKLEINILGQIRLQHGSTDLQYNSIPFVLINNIDITYTDEAELIGDDISNTNTLVMDQNSHTKEVMEKTVTMATPRVDGFFSNAMLFDNGKAWQNLKLVKYQSQLPLLFQPEWDYAERLYVQYGSGQMFVELETTITYETNVRNVCFSVSGLTEAAGYFLPVKRTFDFIRETLAVKLMRHNVAAVE